MITLDDADYLDLSVWIRPGDGIVWGQACAEPVALTSLLAAQAEDLGPLTAFVGATFSDCFEPARMPSVGFAAYCATGRNRAWCAADQLAVIPVHYSALRGLFTSKMIRCDVVFLLVGPADEEGRWSLGLADEYLSAALDGARVVMLEESPFVPCIPGGRTLGPEDVDVVVRSARHPLAMPTTEPRSADIALADQVGELIPDGAVLQIGLGTFSSVVLSRLHQCNDLGIHSGLISDGVADLAESGIVTNAYKSRDVGVTVTGVVMGTERVFNWVNGNKTVALRSTDYTHDLGVLSSLDRFTAINSALEVDLSGQVNAEVIGGRYVGAVGGAVDFLRGAHRSRGGLPITALPAETRGTSRIVTHLSGPVTIGRADVGIVVTEYGHADLRGLGLTARRDALIAIAHPDHRRQLLAEIC
jgi:acetyl-CoA hydrolase